MCERTKRLYALDSQYVNGNEVKDKTDRWNRTYNQKSSFNNVQYM